MQMRREPFCQAPDCQEMADEVDHIVPLARGGARLNPANLQSLCKRCHSKKTVNQDGGFGTEIENREDRGTAHARTTAETNGAENQRGKSGEATIER